MLPSVVVHVKRESKVLGSEERRDGWNQVMESREWDQVHGDFVQIHVQGSFEPGGTDTHTTV